MTTPALAEEVLTSMDRGRPLSVPVILGTPRKGRMSEHVARFMAGELAQFEGVVTEVIDIADLGLATDDEGEAIKHVGFSEAMARADALVIVAPEYNHSFPGMLKHALDTNLKEYIHKAAGVVGVSAGPFGGTRVIQSMLPLLRELGLVSIFWDVNVGSVGRVFDAQGALREQAFVRRAEKFIQELLWMARTLRHGRDAVPSDARRTPLSCERCGGTMNHHADKLVERDAAGELIAVSGCPACGNIRVEPAASL